MENIFNNLDSLEQNWIHKTKCEQVNGIRKQIVELSNQVSDGIITGLGVIQVLSKINELMLKLHETIAE